MQLTRRNLKRVNIYADSARDGGYVGKKHVPSMLGFVYAEVFPEKDTLEDMRSGRRVNGGTTLVLRRGAGVCCGDLAGIFGDLPDSRVVEVRRCPGHVTVRTVRI